MKKKVIQLIIINDYETLVFRVNGKIVDVKTNSPYVESIKDSLL